jgi:hypothetical protein
VTTPWSVENGFITPTFKVKRNRTRRSTGRSSTAGSRPAGPWPGPEGPGPSREGLWPARGAGLARAGAVVRKKKGDGTRFRRWALEPSTGARPPRTSAVRENGRSANAGWPLEEDSAEPHCAPDAAPCGLGPPRQ